VDESLTICRCEEVHLSEIEEAIRLGARSLNEIKRATRAGMGLCQGNTCRRLVIGILARETGTPVAEIAHGTYRPPVRPITLSVLATSEDAGRGEEQTTSDG
jgi:NAD(P)H-nitrite reductase large subunit